MLKIVLKTIISGKISPLAYVKNLIQKSTLAIGDINDLAHRILYDIKLKESQVVLTFFYMFYIYFDV